MHVQQKVRLADNLFLECFRLQLSSCNEASWADVQLLGFKLKYLLMSHGEYCSGLPSPEFKGFDNACVATRDILGETFSLCLWRELCSRELIETVREWLGRGNATIYSSVGGAMPCLVVRTSPITRCGISFFIVYFF